MKCLNSLAVYTRFVYNGLGNLLEGNTKGIPVCPKKGQVRGNT